MADLRERSLFRCEYDLNGECQLYSVKCKKAEMCDLSKGCVRCRFRHQPRTSEPCNRCDENRWR